MELLVAAFLSTRDTNRTFNALALDAESRKYNSLATRKGYGVKKGIYIYIYILINFKNYNNWKVFKR